MKARQIIFTDVNKSELLKVDIPDTLAPDEVMVKTMVSTVSAGTERANYTGDANVSATTAPKVSFPRYPGYSSAGEVIAIGSEVKSVKVGDRVAVYWGYHKEINVMQEKYVVKIEDDSVSYESAAMCYISTFPMAAIRKTHLEMGESAMVMGLGILGIIAVKLLRLAGAVPIIAVDPNPLRRDMALRCGADFALDPFCEGFTEKVREISGGINVAIEVTGVGAGFNQALDCMAKFGRVALLGCTRNSDFTVDYYRKIHAPGITVVGAHTIARPDVESSAGMFTHADDIRCALKLCAGGRLTFDDIVSETHSPEEHGEVYRRLGENRDFPVGVQFDWRMLK